MVLAPADSELSAVSRRALIAGDGTAYLELRPRLTPRWGRLWASLAAGHVALVAVAAGVVVASGRSVAVDAAVVVGGALAVGYLIHYLVLFQHEAVHFNLAPSRRANDLLCDAAIGVLIGERVAAYRPIHLDHHRHLGTVKDTERSYFEPLGAGFVLRGLSGVRITQIVLARASHRADAGPAAPNETRPGVPWVLLGAVALHASVVVGALVAGVPALALAWGFGVICAFPAINTTRQLLEHRGVDADRAVDYSTIDHGPVNRIFGSGPLASTLGAAGFNRHLLHHWDPGVSCTRLRDLERFLLDTPAAAAVAQHRTTYAATARRLTRR